MEEQEFKLKKSDLNTDTLPTISNQNRLQKYYFSHFYEISEERALVAHTYNSCTQEAGTEGPPQVQG